MKTHRNILVAFILNLSFAIFECFGGIFTGSVAILSDAIHDIGDAVSIGLSYYLEKKSQKQPDSKYTYGYGRFSVLGGLITTTILFLGSIFVIFHAVARIITPTPIHYKGMVVFAILGVCVNLSAALFTANGHSINQRAVNLHMLEDVLGWVMVLLGAIVMGITNFTLLDPLMSIGVALFILYHAIGNLKEVADLFLLKAPKHVDIPKIKAHLEVLEGIVDVHHIHLWSIDGQHHYASAHIVTEEDPVKIKELVRQTLLSLDIGHVTLELETTSENCHQRHCHVEHHHHSCGHHHHHH